MEKLFSIQEKIFAENGLNAALEANFHRNQIKSVKFSSQNSSTTADHNLQNSENRIPSMASTATTDFETFKSVNLEIFPYVKLLTLWRNNCFTNIMKKLQTEKVTHVPKHYAKYFPDIFFCLFSHIPAPYLPFFCLPLFPIPFPSPYLLTFLLIFLLHLYFCSSVSSYFIFFFLICLFFLCPTIFTFYHLRKSYSSFLPIHRHDRFHLHVPVHSVYAIPAQGISIQGPRLISTTQCRDYRMEGNKAGRNSWSYSRSLTVLRKIRKIH